MKAKNTLIVLMILCCSCITSARLEMKDGSFVDGEILGSTESEVFVKAKDGPGQTIKRLDIADIDHPGNVTLVGGVVLIIYAAGFSVIGIANLRAAAAGRARAEEERALEGLLTQTGAQFSETVGWAFVTIGAVFLAGGVPAVVGGADIWTTSKDRVESPGFDSLEISIGRGLSIKATF